MSNDIVINSEGNLKSVEYVLQRNQMASQKAGSDTYVGVVMRKATYGLQDVAAQMVKEGCAVKESTIRLVLSEFATLTADLVACGHAVNIGGLVRFAPVIRGTFAGEDALWDAKKNRLMVKATVGSRLRSVAASSSPLRMNQAVLPTLAEVIDLTSGEANQVQAGKPNFLLRGTKLTWDEEAEDEGFYLVCAGVETKCTAYGESDDTHVFLSCSPISGAESARLIFRTRMGGDTLFQAELKADIAVLGQE